MTDEIKHILARLENKLARAEQAADFISITAQFILTLTECEDEPNITHHYDEVADVLYIDFGSDEPCYTENLDDLLMIEIGWFSKKMHGIRIVGPKENGCFEKLDYAKFNRSEK